MHSLKSGFVHDSPDNMDTNGQYYIIWAHVHVSMKAQLPLNAEVYISNISGFVISGKCDCRLVVSCFFVGVIRWGRQVPLHYYYVAIYL